MGLLNRRSHRSAERQKFWRAREYFLAKGALKRSRHGLRVGDRSGYYFDIDIILNDPSMCQTIADIYMYWIDKVLEKHRVDVLAFIEKGSGGTVGAIRLAGILSVATKIPNIVVRPKKNIRFEKAKIPFYGQSGERLNQGLDGINAVVVTDHCTTGREVLIAKNILEDMGARVNSAVAYTVRNDKFAKDDFTNEGIDLHAAFSLPPAKDMPHDLDEFTFDEIEKIAVNYY